MSHLRITQRKPIGRPRLGVVERVRRAIAKGPRKDTRCAFTLSWAELVELSLLADFQRLNASPNDIHHGEPDSLARLGG